jgi:hypothetical protein
MLDEAEPYVSLHRNGKTNRITEKIGFLADFELFGATTAPIQRRLLCWRGPL